MCECSFIGPVTPGPDATDSLHEGVSRVGMRDVDDDDAACFLLSIACARVWVIECKGCLGNAFGHPLLSLLSSIILLYFTLLYLFIFAFNDESGAASVLFLSEEDGRKRKEGEIRPFNRFEAT